MKELCIGFNDRLSEARLLTSSQNSDQSQDLIITIPGPIAVLPITLQEKAALSRIEKIPGASNDGIARLLGISERGVEDLLRRLREQGYVERFGHGRARQHRLTSRVQSHGKRGIQDEVSSHENCGIQSAANSHENRVLSLDEVLVQSADRMAEVTEGAINGVIGRKDKFCVSTAMTSLLAGALQLSALDKSPGNEERRELIRDVLSQHEAIHREYIHTQAIEAGII